MTSNNVHLAVSTVILTVRPTGPDNSLELWMPLVRRIRDPFRHMWALPGGPLHSNEGLEDSAKRDLAQTTGLAPAHLEQLATFGSPDRSGGAEERVVTVVYWASLPPTQAAQGENDLNVAWHEAHSLPPLAFDHADIVDHALAHLSSRIADPRVAKSFLPEVFTLAELRQVHEAILDRFLDAPNFRRHVMSGGLLEDTGERVKGARHRPPALYRFSNKTQVPTLFNTPEDAS